MASRDPSELVRWYTTAEVAARLSMSVDYVRARIRDGSLPARAVRSGGRVIFRVRAEDLEAFRREHVGDPTDPRFGG